MTTTITIHGIPYTVTTAAQLLALCAALNPRKHAA